MQLRSDGKWWTFGAGLLPCLLAFGATMVITPASAAGSRRVAYGSMAPVQSTIRSIRDQIQRENYASGVIASRRHSRQSKR